MQTVFQIKNEINKLSYPQKLELLKFTREQLKHDDSTKLSLRDAAEQMKELYLNDKELTAFSSIEGDFYEEG